MADPEALPITLRLNGRVLRVDTPPWLTAVELFRDSLGLTGTKTGCGAGECGSCTVLLDGAPMLACLILAAELDGTSVTTIEGMRMHPLTPLQQAFLDTAGYQCGFCTPGMLLAASMIPRGVSDSEVRGALAGNLCRCTGYTKIVEAVARSGAQH